MSTTDAHGQEGRAADLAGAVLEAEAERERLQGEADKQILFADDLLPGVGGEEMSLREGLRAGAGSFPFFVLMLLIMVDELESATLGVLAPDIRDSLGISSGTMVFLASASGSFLILGALPMGWMADRMRRARIIGFAHVVFAVFLFLCGIVKNAFQLFWTRLGVGVAKSSNYSVNGTFIADAYPIGVRGRVGAATFVAGRMIGTLSPVIVTGIATLAGGPDGWRWAYISLAIPVAVVSFLAFRLPEPPRGQFEKQDVLGEVFEDEKPAPISVEAAFARLWQIQTFKSAIVAFAALGFGLFTVPVLSNIFLEDEFGAKAFERGIAATVGGIGVFVVLPFVGRYYDRLYRKDPEKALRIIGYFILPAALLTPVQYFMPNVPLFVLLGVPQIVLMLTAFAMVGPLLQAICPYRLRGLGGALGSLYIFFIGATGGALLSGLLSDEFGPRTAVIAIVVPTSIIGGYLFLRGSRSIKYDLSLVVAELQEELDEHKRQQADPEDIPALQVNNVDYSYGPVQVLFDVGFEVRSGEVLALLGTNGAGKSTILRAIAGLGTPSRGVIRLHGQTITYATPEQRARMGIRILIGGKGVFPAMTVRENLEMAAFVYRKDEADFEHRIDRMYDLFPALSEKRRDAASTLSGGQQQMLALAMTLLHEPDVLAIDELSLGLAPVLVQELLGVVERLKEEGMTIIIVEQSLNVALSIADRAVFLEKGQVRFIGPAAELAERDDLARAVFLGKEGG